MVLMANCIIWLSYVSVIHSTKCSLWVNFRLEIYKQICTTVLRPPFFLIYINDLPEGLKLLADDNSSFSIVKCVNTTALTLNNFWKRQDLTYQWEMSFNPNQIKQAQKVNVSRKTNINREASLYFNNTTVKQTPVRST